MPRLVFHPDVSAEIRASYSWYQELTEGLGDDFLDELESAYEAILEFPQTWPLFQKGFQVRNLSGGFLTYKSLT